MTEWDDTINGGNADGLINAQDAVFSDLRIWQDLNSNGETDAGELQTLSYWGINQISLATTATEQIIANNELRAEAIFSDGEAVNKRIGEVLFGVDFFDNDMVSGAGTVFARMHASFSGCSMMHTRLIAHYGRNSILPHI